MQICFKCSSPLQNANGEAIYKLGENVILLSKVLRTLFVYEIWQKYVCPNCKVVHYELALINKKEIAPPFLFCPENRIERRKL